MSTLDKLRALHQEVCREWRRANNPAIPEGEAEILNLGLQLLESLSERYYDIITGQLKVTSGDMLKMVKYVNCVHSQFDSDADIKITESNSGK